MVGFTFASSVLLAALSLSDAQDGTYSPTPSATYPPTVTEFPTSSTYEPTLTEYPTYFETYDPTITAYPTTIESPTVTLAMAVSEARRQQNAAGTKKLSLKGAATNTDEPCGQDDEDGTGTIPTSARKGSEKRSRRQEKRSQRHAKRAAKRAARKKENRSAMKEKRSAMKEKRSAKKQSRMEKRAAMKEKRATRKDDWACVAQCGKTRSDDTEKCLAECRNANSVPPGDDTPLFEIA